MKQLVKMAGKSMILIILGIIIGFVALLFVHMLPTSPMRENVYWSLSMIEKEFTDEVLVEGNNATLTGNFTDCLMLQHGVYSTDIHGVLEQALCMYRSESYNAENDPEGWWPGQSLKDYIEGVEQPREVSYARYWHGYLVVLKPLLLLMSFNSIRLLNSAMQLFFVGWVIMKMCEKKGYLLANAFLISLPFMFFISTYSSLSLSICFYITLFTLLIQLKYDEKIYKNKHYSELFLIVGMATSYFDFLTYPLITLLYPLCVYFYFHLEEKYVENIKKLVGFGWQWIIGYLGMWSGKWILTELFTGGGIIKDALCTTMGRVQHAEGANRFEGFVYVVEANMQVYSNWCYFLLGILVVVILLWNVKKIGIKNWTKKLKNSTIFYIIALCPFVWYFLIQNHSEQHWQFTCRILAATAFAGITALMQLIKKDNE